jgi:hypothetical protein
MYYDSHMTELSWIVDEIAIMVKVSYLVHNIQEQVEHVFS